MIGRQWLADEDDNLGCIIYDLWQAVKLAVESKAEREEEK